MQQTTIYASKWHSPSSANAAFCENVSTMAAKASSEISVPQTDSINYTKKSTEPSKQQRSVFLQAVSEYSD